MRKIIAYLPYDGGNLDIIRQFLSDNGYPWLPEYENIDKIETDSVAIYDDDTLGIITSSEFEEYKVSAIEGLLDIVVSSDNSTSGSFFG